MVYMRTQWKGCTHSIGRLLYIFTPKNCRNVFCGSLAPWKCVAGGAGTGASGQPYRIISLMFAVGVLKRIIRNSVLSARENFLHPQPDGSPLVSIADCNFQSFMLPV